MGMEKNKLLSDSRKNLILGKGKLLLKLTSRNTLALNDVLHVSSIKVNLIFVTLLRKVGVKVLFESKKIVMTKNMFMEKRYCDQDLIYLTYLILLMNLHLSLLLILLILMMCGMLDYAK